MTAATAVLAYLSKCPLAKYIVVLKGVKQPLERFLGPDKVNHTGQNNDFYSVC